MKKKGKILIGILILIFTFYLGTIAEDTNLKNDSSKKRTIAMYLENDDGGYDLSSQNKFLTEGYVLNTQKSTCKNGGILSQDPTTKKLSLSVSNSDQCTVYFDKENITTTTIAYGLKANLPSVTEYSKGDTKEMYVFDHDIVSTDTNSYTYTASQIENWSADERRDYRYIGSNPNNYLTFNDETWRIIGVFTVETEGGNKEQLIKIIRNESIGDLPWDTGKVNEWSTASLKTLLNGDYYNQKGSYTSTYSAKGLNETSRNQIANVKWYLGGSSRSPGLGGPNYYSFERGKTVISGRNTNVVAKVGLIYPSDYVYTYAYGVNEQCYKETCYCNKEVPTAGWLFNGANQWTISPHASSSISAHPVQTTGAVQCNFNVSGNFGVRPVVYLKSNIQIKSGTGASGDPYIIG